MVFRRQEKVALTSEGLKNDTDTGNMKESPDHQHRTKFYKVERVERLDDNLFVVKAKSRVKKVAVIDRNMVVLRHNKRELTLINPVQLDADGEDRLLQLGSVQRIIRLAPHHGASHDRYYLERFPTARRWAPISSSSDDAENEDKLPVHRVLSIEDDSILPGCHVFCFQGTAQPECAVLILQDYVGNLLVTAHVLQSHRDNPHVNALVRAGQMAQGLMQTSIVIPPSWLRTMSFKSSRQSSRKILRSECERLLRLDFERLISSSGMMIYQQAKEKAVMAVDLAFPQW